MRISYYNKLEKFVNDDSFWSAHEVNHCKSDDSKNALQELLVAKGNCINLATFCDVKDAKSVTEFLDKLKIPYVKSYTKHNLTRVEIISKGFVKRACDKKYEIIAEKRRVSEERRRRKEEERIKEEKAKKIAFFEKLKTDNYDIRYMKQLLTYGYISTCGYIVHKHGNIIHREKRYAPRVLKWLKQNNLLPPGEYDTFYWLMVYTYRKWKHLKKIKKEYREFLARLKASVN